ncbi:MAG TPA: nickel-binding protein [Actinomycetota bacterium]
MPVFLDVHEWLPEGTTAEAFAELHRRDVDVQGLRGVRYERTWLDERARKAFCLVHAPDAEAAAAVHREAHGLLADRIYRVIECATERGGGDMTAPFIFIGTYSIKEGKAEEARNALGEHAEFVETNEPRLISFNVYFNGDGSAVSIIQVHPDAASMDFHMRLIAEHISTAFDEYLDGSLGTQVYGHGESTVDTIKRFSPPGVQVTVVPTHVSGFTRTNAR